MCPNGHHQFGTKTFASHLCIRPYLFVHPVASRCTKCVLNQSINAFGWQKRANESKSTYLFVVLLQFGMGCTNRMLPCHFTELDKDLCIFFLQCVCSSLFCVPFCCMIVLIFFFVASEMYALIQTEAERAMRIGAIF